MALYSRRHVPLFAIIVTPILAAQLQAFLDRSADPVTTRIKNRLALIGVLAAASAGWLRYGFDEKKVPVRAVDFLLREPIPDRMYNPEEIGDYLIYAAWPRYRVFYDSRHQMYGTAVMREYLKVEELRPGWDGILEKHKIGWAIVYADSPLAYSLTTRTGWKLIYADPVANIFVRTAPEYLGLIEKYPDVRPAPAAPPA